MNRDELLQQIQDRTIDTVHIAAPDMFGRLVGKRFAADHFAREVETTHGCNYLFAVNLNMEPQNGYPLTSWDVGFGDFEMRPDPAACFPLPWEPGAAMILADFHHHDGAPVEESPRNILRRQLARLAERGLHANIASELEFFLYNEDYPTAASKGYTGLTPSSQYRIDYHLLQTARDEPLMRDIRQQMIAAGLPIECSKGEWSAGQHEINMRYADPLVMADRHTLFKYGAKHLAYLHGKSITFMAKPFHGEAGSSCHIHISLAAENRNVFWDGEKKTASPMFRQFLGGLMTYSRELCLFYAPNINSYKRYEAMSWAPTRLAWATDNRTTGFRVVGEGAAFRVENRMPGADANPYLAFAAMIAAGLAGIDAGLDCGAEHIGNAYVDTSLPTLPATLRDAHALFEKSEIAHAAFGGPVVQHYSHQAALEIREFDAAVTDWERKRYFEQI